MSKQAFQRGMQWLCWALLAVSLVLDVALPVAEAQIPSRSHHADRLNEQYGTRPQLDADQLRGNQPVPGAITPANAEAPYIRALERLAAQPTSGSGRTAVAGASTPAEAAWLLGLLYLHGLGTGTHPAKAREWFAQAQRLRHPLAPAGLAWCQLDGCGQQPQPQQATPWIEQLRKSDAGRAAYLEWLRNQKTAPLEVATPQNPQLDDAPRQPSALILRSARAGDPYGQNELGIFYAQTGRRQEARRLFAAAGARSPAAQANLDWLERSAQATRTALPAPPGQQGGEALFLRARQFHRGDGVPVNYVEAMRLYRLAASQGNAHAQQMLGLIYTRPTPTGDINIVWMQQLANVDITREGGGTLMEPPPSPLPQHDPTPLYDYVPPRLRSGP
ncbi:hypothetical protein GCM10027082_07800 [Comamonas humi]